ncbi:hypothetical protein [Streptomyces sp. NPDC057694]|uniref:hypothetical protein n=1 Tax=Streptomyces sp. NPDC057694 TaxID=3346216 RepID=UPI0036846466
MKARRSVLGSVGPQEIVSVLAGVLALAGVVIRARGRVRLAREHRKAITSVAEAVAGAGRARIEHRSAAAHWSLEVGNMPVIDEAVRSQGRAAVGDVDR